MQQQQQQQQAEWDEQSELRELNCRLWHYVSRVRDLEQENRRLAHELAALRGQERRVCGLREQEDEVTELRLVAAELSRAKGEAELERDALRQELARLERLGAQSVELRRRRLEPELAEQRQQLERLRADCAALEGLLERLLGERRRLQEARRRRPAQLPALPAPPPPRAKAVSVGRRELEESCALVLSWSCDQSLERYDAELRALQELEGRLGRENLQKLRAHNEHSRRQLDELYRRCRELSALAERLEQERLAMQEHQGAELVEYQMIIEALEEEKRYLTMSIAEYLKDYHELLQVKASLSLEIETYRALLEGESSQWILMWDEEHGRKLPQGVRNMLYEYSNRRSTSQQEKGRRTFPAIQNVDTRYKSPVTNISSSAAHLSRTKAGGMQAAAPEKTLRRDAFRPSAATKKDGTHERILTEQREIRTFSPPYRISRDGEVLQRTFPERKRAEAGSTVYFSKESTTGRKHRASPNISENVKTKVGISTFPSYSQISSSKETKQERTTEGTRTRANEQIKDSKPWKEGKTTFLEASAVEKISEELSGEERNVNFQKKTEIKGMDEKKHTVEEFKDNRKEDRFMSDKTPKEGSYVRLEDWIRMDTPGKNLPADVKFEESRSFHREKDVSMVRQSKEEIPTRSEVHTHGQVLKNNVEITSQDLKAFAGKRKNETASELTREPNQDGVNEEESSKVGSSLTESIAENIVSDILKGFVQTSSDAKPPPDTKASIFEKKDFSEDGKLKTEIIIQSTAEEELNVSDEFDLGSALKKDVEKVLEESKGAVAKDVLEDIVKARVKGMEGDGKRTVQVEIVEEPLGTTADERMEFSTPFEVEEAEDTSPGMAGHRFYGDEEKATTSASVDLKQRQPSVIVSHVEEVPEGDDVVDEEKYFVSTPDEYPLGHEQDEGSIYGQIHIEEESTVTYSWQDEFLQGSQTQKNESMGSPELIYEVMGGEAGAFVSKEDVPQEQVAHAESIVIQKEIKIPPEFHESIKGLFSQESKDPKHQLKEALEKLEDTLPESIKQELSALTKESQGDSSSLEVDIKKVEHNKKGDLFTIVAEVNLSQTLDSDQFTELLGKGVADEIKLPTQSQSKGGFVEYMKQESESSGDGRDKIGIDVFSTPWTIEEGSSSAKLSSSDGMEYLSNEHVSCQGPVFKSVGANSKEHEYPLQGSFDSNRHIQQIVVGPTEIRRTEHILYEGPTSETLDFGSGATADISQSIKEFNLGPEEIQTTEKIIYRGPVHKTVELSGSESPVQAQFSTDIRSSKHITLGSNQIVEEIVFEGPASDISSINSREGLLQMQGPAETSRSIRHIQIDPKEIHTEQVVYEGPISGFMESSSSGDRILTEESLRHIRLGQKDTQLSDQVVYEESSHKRTGPNLCMEGVPDTNTTIRHIKLSPKEFVTEQMVFTGPTSKQHLEFGEPGQVFSSEGSVMHIKLGQKDIRSGEQAVYQGSVSESSGFSSSGEDILEGGGLTEFSRSMRHVRLSPSETASEQIVFHGPVSETFSLGTADLSPTDGPSENSKSVGHITIGGKEASFTFQMDVPSLAGAAQEATVFVPNRKGADALQLEGTVKESQKDTGSEQRSFHKTVQLQRMVDQRSVISDEKKIALLYLNENEGEEEDDGPWF